MADTKRTALGEIPVEGDGISYRGIIWFVAVLVITTLVSQVLMVGLFKYLEHDADVNGVPRNALAAPVGQLPPGPNLAQELRQSNATLGIVSDGRQGASDEPSVLQTFREMEEQKLSTYQWIDKNAGTVRIPIERAKELLIERGLPSGAPAPAPPPAGPAKQGKQ
jgi:hypothetical protein